MNREQQQEHAIRLVAEHLDDNLEFLTVAEDEQLEDHEDDWQEIHNLCGQLINQLHNRVDGKAPYVFWTDHDVLPPRVGDSDRFKHQVLHAARQLIDILTTPLSDQGNYSSWGAIEWQDDSGDTWELALTRNTSTRDVDDDIE